MAERHDPYPDLEPDDNDMAGFVGWGDTRMSAERRKGVQGEREVAAIWEAAGAVVHSLADSGGYGGQTDQLVQLPSGLVVHSQIKRQERLRLWEWLSEMDEFPLVAGEIAVCSFRRSRQPWWSVLRTDALAGLLNRG